MKLEKLSFLAMQRELTRKEIKKIIAGVTDCQHYGQRCDQGQQLNSCSGLCINNSCGMKLSVPERSGKKKRA